MVGYSVGVAHVAVDHIPSRVRGVRLTHLPPIYIGRVPCGGELYNRSDKISKAGLRRKRFNSPMADQFC